MVSSARPCRETDDPAGGCRRKPPPLRNRRQRNEPHISETQSRSLLHSPAEPTSCPAGKRDASPSRNRPMASAAGDKPPVNDAMAASSEQSKVSPLSIRGAGVSVASARVEPCPASNFPLLRSAFPLRSAGDPFFVSLILLRSAFLPRAIVPSHDELAYRRIAGRVAMQHSSYCGAVSLGQDGSS